MQVVGARQGSTARADLPMPRPDAYWIGSAKYAPDASPWIVVEDWTDIPARQTRPGYFWYLESNEDSPHYGQAVEVPYEQEPNHYANLLVYLAARREIPGPWETLFEHHSRLWEEKGGC